VERLRISAGEITALGSSGAGIGAGFARGGDTVVDHIEITGGVISAVGQLGAGIGAGLVDSGRSFVSTVSIPNGTFTVKGTTGIGGDGEFVNLGGLQLNRINIVCEPETTYCVTGEQVALSGVMAGFGGGAIARHSLSISTQSSEIYWQYKGRTTEAEPFQTLAFVQVNDATKLGSGDRTLIVQRPRAADRRALYRGGATGFLVTAGGAGIGTIEVEGMGQICHDKDNQFSFAVSGTMYESVHLCSEVSGLTSGAIAGIIIGVIALAAVIGVVAFLVVTKKLFFSHHHAEIEIESNYTAIAE
jgi:hypothetical protein